MRSPRRRPALLSAGLAAALSAGLAAAPAGAGPIVGSTVASAAVETRYEAETAPATCDGTIDTNHSGYSGTGFCNGDNAVGAAVQFTLDEDASATGTATLLVRFANASSAARAAEVVVNGTTVQSVSFQPTGAWSTWATTTLTVSLDPGSNTIRLNPTSAAGLPNVDYLDAEAVTTPTRYEAETAPATCDGTIDSDHGGYSGTGFCNGDPEAGAAAQFTVNASETGTATLAIRYANGATAARPADLIVNGDTVLSTSFQPTGGWSGWTTKTSVVQLNSGDNTIRLSPTGADGLPNIDYLEFELGDIPQPPGWPQECERRSPIVCHFDVAPGNYEVTAWVGDRDTAGNTSMSVEARRRVLHAVDTAAGTITEHTFTINVRQPEGQPTGQGGTGNPGLDITFAGSAPRLSGLTVQPANDPMVVYLAGDSTTCDQPLAPWTGWGQLLPTQVSEGAVVANYGDSGESSGSFLRNSALFPTMRPLIQSDDLVLIQFGHNDKSTSASAFRGNLASMINQVRDRGGDPVLVTPPVRRHFDGDRLTPTARHVNGVGVDLPAEMRRLGSELGVPVIDLTAKSQALVESLGPNESARLYLRQAEDGYRDNTHFSEYGAGRMADLVVEGVREHNLSLVSYLR
ncbi:carbohydrate-binding protein [Myceligenerans pegani]|uniref:Carbohydrate-binding protein n=1 Tax=Myceligenerans pegani TaxID=2776917 RepID=A0ABR9N1T2_9MICO|nr:CBM35 domain-containing protein [Myceligenerans sp. TRM 65318]MBE1877617.1 carbohydrate-binding protein [Myceligenerans sp. TRM 65318]MBE3019888.1 carbohydrate-binding protein [Myceligenerans sp. TRM 65318]